MSTPAPSAPRSGPRPSRIVLGAFLGASLGLGAAFLSIERAPAGETAALPDYGALADFQLIERSGRPLTLADLRGYVWIADFIFTSCAGVCPDMTSRMAELQRDLPIKKGIKLVSVTVDPARDTRQALAAYAERAGARPGAWLFLTGEAADIRRLVSDGFHLAADEDPLMHSPHFVLVDRLGRIRGYYDSSDPERLRALARDARALVRETS